MKRAIVTGATGVIGVALLDELVKNNVETLIFCREESIRNKLIPDHPLIKKIYCRLEDLTTVQNDTGTNYDVFYHLAWDGTFGLARNDMYLQNNNVRYALDAVTVAKNFGCRTFIGAGSQAEYGRAGGKLRPTTPTFPEMGYGYAKLCAGQMTRDYAHQLGMEHIWTRILSVYGPHDNEQTMIMSTINKLRAGIVPEFTKGEQLWDYLYSEDAARALYLLGNRGIDGKIYVLGSGEARPLAEFICIIRECVAPDMQIALGAIPYNKNQVMYLCADIEDLIYDCGFKPTTSFERGIRNIIEKKFSRAI